jgi:hypothetical protein
MTNTFHRFFIAVLLGVFSLSLVVPVSAATSPVDKTLLATLPIPWGNTIPAKDDLKVFSCKERVYLVWQEQVPDGYKGQVASKIFVLKTDGTAISTAWRELARDSINSVLRFTGTCVGERAVLTNHWEDPVHGSAGDMATSVTGEEAYGPLWRPDGRTIYHWYKTDGSQKYGSWDKPLHTLVVEQDRVSITGMVVKTATLIAGSSANYFLEDDGSAHAAYSPWYGDLDNVRPSGEALSAATFIRSKNAWQVSRADYSGNVSVALPRYTTSIRKDFTADWTTFDASRDLSLGAWCASMRTANNNALGITTDGLTVRTASCGSQGKRAYQQAASAVVVHRAATTDLFATPRIYSSAIVLGSVGDSFVYGVRTGDAKLQIWHAVVR